MILSGCGHGDGTDALEVSSIQIHSARLGLEPSYFAPNKSQDVVFNHAAHQVDLYCERRNVLDEASRLVRPPARALSELHPRDFDMVLIPGGAGVGLHLSDVTLTGAVKSKVDAGVQRVLTEFLGRPVGTISEASILPVLAAATRKSRARNARPILVTVGRADSAEFLVKALGQWGSPNVETRSSAVCCDDTSRVYSHAGSLVTKATPWDLFRGIGLLVKCFFFFFF